MAQINDSTTLMGLIGWPVAHSFSPAMHNAAAAAAGLNVVYVPLPVRPDDLWTAVLALPVFNFRGVNVTIPYKHAVIPILNDIDPAAAAIGAVNTIVIDTPGREAGDYENGRQPGHETFRPHYITTGYNTDWSGLLADLKSLGVLVNGRDCLVLGAGGSARAVAFGLASAGGQVQVLARRMDQAQQLVIDLSPHIANLSAEALLNYWPLAELKTAVSATTAPLIVNTTPLGMSPHVDISPWPDGLPFPTGAFVYDLVYNPRQTKLMQQAAAAGCGTANGLGMLVNQGALAFELWTGVMPDVEIMKAEIKRQ